MADYARNRMTKLVVALFAAYVVIVFAALIIGAVIFAAFSG